MGKISHKGVVEAVDADTVKVRITQGSACAACRVANHCSAAESKEKTVEVVCTDAGKYAVGDEVVVSMPMGNGSRAVSLAFVFPFLVMLAVLLLTLWATGDEALSALLAIASLIPYYAFIYLSEKKIAKKFSFVIEQSTNIN
ncbi:MAG: SoxR reducing system RseC family protein [Prevotella sp.]|nr:SoxR reducing system RseC family protein [Prevotella sp.]